MDSASTPAGDAEKPHAVCVPFPAQGHVTPMMKLAKILHSKGFHVTFVNTEYNHRRLLQVRGGDALAGLPGFRFATIPDGLPPCDADVTQDAAAICHSTMTTCLPHFKSLLADLNRSAGVPPVTCVVGDAALTFTVDAAVDLGVPCALLWTASACGSLGYRHYRLFIDRGLVPLKDAEQLTNGFLDTPVDWARGMSKHVRIRDFPSFLRTTDRDDIMLNYSLHETDHMADADAIIYNTFDELEQPALDALRAALPPAVYTVGPLNLLAEQLVPAGGPLDALGSNLWKEDHTCLDWLDGREPRSVVYVNYGSITVMTNQELVEFAWGLANSGYAFLWIVRPDQVNGDGAVLPPECLEATKDRGLLASWCPQEAVLCRGDNGLKPNPNPPHPTSCVVYQLNPDQPIVPPSKPNPTQPICNFNPTQLNPIPQYGFNPFLTHPIHPAQLPKLLYQPNPKPNQSHHGYGPLVNSLFDEVNFPWLPHFHKHLLVTSIPTMEAQDKAEEEESTRLHVQPGGVGGGAAAAIAIGAIPMHSFIVPKPEAAARARTPRGGASTLPWPRVRAAVHHPPVLAVAQDGLLHAVREEVRGWRCKKRIAAIYLRRLLKTWSAENLRETSLQSMRRVRSLSGLTSRCATPRRWQAASAAASWAVRSAASGSGRRPRAETREKRSPPAQRSSTRWTTLASSNAAWSATTCGLASGADARRWTLGSC